MLLAAVAVIFIVLILLSMPIVFALAVAGIAGLWIGGYPMQQLSSALVSGSQSWVLLAIPAFVFAGNLMERCGMSHALVELARALIGWVKGGLGMSMIVVAYFFSDICGSKMAEVSALGSALMPPLTKAGYDPRDSACPSRCPPRSGKQNRAGRSRPWLEAASAPNRARKLQPFSIRRCRRKNKPPRSP